MKGDFTRNTFKPQRHYQQVLLQQVEPALIPITGATVKQPPASPVYPRVFIQLQSLMSWVVQEV